MSDETIECPYCRARIKNSAKVCASCLRNLETGERIDLASLSAPEPPPKQSADEDSEQTTDESRQDEAVDPVPSKSALPFPSQSSRDETPRCPFCKSAIADTEAVICVQCGHNLKTGKSVAAPDSTTRRGEEADEQIVRRIADYYRISAVLWLVIAIIQILCIVPIIAGIWNLFASISRFKMIERIRDRDPEVVKANQGIGQLMTLGIVNLLLGAAVGIVFVILDFYIRDKVLTHAHLFSGDGLVGVPAGSSVSSPAAMQSPVPTASTSADDGRRTRQCPYCAEDILVQAIKCKHCGSMLTRYTDEPAPRLVAGDEFGTPLLMIPVCTSILMWLVGGAFGLDGTVLSWMTIISTAVLAGAEAKRLGMGIDADRTESGYRRPGPLGWCFSLLLLWLPCYPIYMSYRGRYGVRKHGALGFLIMLLFVGSLLGLSLPGVRMALLEAPRGRASEDARMNAATLEVQVLKSAVNMYEIDNGHYPGSISECVPKYLDKVPVDPWGIPYSYDPLTGTVGCSRLTGGF